MHYLLWGNRTGHLCTLFPLREENWKIFLHKNVEEEKLEIIHLGKFLHNNFEEEELEFILLGTFPDKRFRKKNWKLFI